MTPVNLDAVSAAVLSWLLTYAIHSTVFVAAAAIAAWRFAEHHAWLDPIWKAALVAPLLTASLNIQSIALPIALAPAEAEPTQASGVEQVTRQQGDVPTFATATVGRQAPGLPPSPRLRWAGKPSWRAATITRWPLIAVFAWIGMAGFALVRYGVRFRRVHRAIGAGAPVTSSQLLGAVNDVCSGANERRSIRLIISDHCPVPVALSRGQIVVPPRLLEELDPEQQRAALAHEIAHVIRRDPEWRMAVDILERALFFQPLNRLARTRLCDSAECLCDEWAVRHTQSPVALARCLSIVASWWRPADTLPAGVSAMARSESAMVRRVTRILDAPANSTRPRLLWLAIPVAIVAIAAPRVTAMQLPAPVSLVPAVAAVLSTANTKGAEDQRGPRRAWTAAEIASARAQLRVNRLDRPGVSLEERWRQALADAGRQGLGDFWIAYTFTSPAHADDVVMSDTREGSYFSSDGHWSDQGPPLAGLINPSAVALEGGNLAVLLHYRGARADAVDRGSYRSVQLGFDFGRTPVFWLGTATDADSFSRVQTLFGTARDRRIQVFLIELASLHPNSNAVIPFLTRLVDPSWPAEIRSEAAEGFDHHHDPRSVEVLARVARTDPSSEVRTEAAETIGEVQTPQSIPALMDLVNDSPDPSVRQEAAEAFGSQPAAQALAAIENVIATNEHQEVLAEAIEAIGEIQGSAAVSLLVQIVNTHRNPGAQQEAVETLGDLHEAPGIVDALTRIVWEHQDVVIQSEAVETLGDRRDDPAATAALERIAREHDREPVQSEAIETLTDGDDNSIHPLILELAASGKSPRIRREALEAIGDAAGKIADTQALDRAEAVIERAVFDDPDRSVQMEALAALDEFPNSRALRALRDIVARHPDVRVRREAEDHLRERQ